MVYVYAVAEPGGDRPTGSGLEGSPLRVVATGELAAVVSDRADVRLPVSEEALWAHERVVERLMSDRAVLPMRFGSVLPDDAAVEAMLSARRAELLAGLRRVRGTVELGVRAAWEPEAEPTGNPRPGEPPVEAGSAPAGPGASYLLGLARSRRRAHELSERLDRSVAGLFRERVRRLLVTPGLPVSGAYLVDPAHVEAFRTRVDALDAEVQDAEVVCSGPWPPYSFMGAQDS